MRRFELSLNDIAGLHLQFAEAGQRLNPTPEWFRLTEAAPRKVTDNFQGEALRARDLHDAAYLLRGFYFLATKKWLPRGDEIGGRQVDYERRHLPRNPQPKEFQRVDLRALLMAQGIYPHRIHFFVEGQTEKIVMDRLLKFLGYDPVGSGFVVTNIRGVDQAQRYAELFKAAQQVASRAVLIADREGTLSKTLAQLQADGLFKNPQDVLLWEDENGSLDFEEANFSDVEIVRAIRSVALRERGVELALTVAEIRTERAGKTRPRRSPPALTQLALAMAEDRGVRVSKTELAKVLADKLAREIRETGHLVEAGKKRPLLARLYFWIINDR